jgi:mannose-6-phosphate isomerase-like protein (cupin superfamily)
VSITVVKPPLAEMRKGLARFSELSRCDTGLPDMQLPECKRAFYNVLGFDQPSGGEDRFSPFGDAAKAPVSHLKAGFGISFITAEPGKGVLMHTHDTVETFMVMKGEWKMQWEGEQGDEEIVLKPLDFFAIPVGVQRRFECVKAAQGEAEGLLLGIIEGNAPAAEISPQGVARLVEAGIYPPEKLAA